MDGGRRISCAHHQCLLSPSGAGALSLPIKISIISTPQKPGGVRVTLIKLVGLAFVTCELEVGPGMPSSQPCSTVCRQSSIEIFLLAATRRAKDVFWGGVVEVRGFFIPCCQTYIDQPTALAVEVAQLGLEQGV